MNGSRCGVTCCRTLNSPSGSHGFQKRADNASVLDATAHWRGTRREEKGGLETHTRLAVKHLRESDINNLSTSHRQTLLTSLEIKNNNNLKDKLKNSVWKRSTQHEITGLSRL